MFNPIIFSVIAGARYASNKITVLPMAVAHNDGTYVTLYDQLTWRKFIDVPVPPVDSGRAVDFNGDGTILAVGHFTTPYLTFYNTRTLQQLDLVTQFPDGTVFDIAFSPDGQTMVCALGSSACLAIYNTSDWSKYSGPISVPSAAGTINCCEFSPNGQMLIMTSSGSPYYRIYNTSDWTTGPTLSPFTSGYSRGASWSPDGSMLAIVTNDILQIYETTSFTRIATPVVPPTLILYNPKWSPDGSKLSVGRSSNNTLTVYNTADWTYVEVPNLFTEVFDHEWSPNGEYIGLGTSSFKLYDSINLTDTALPYPALDLFSFDVSFSIHPIQVDPSLLVPAPEDFIDRTSNLYWANWPDGDIEYVWNSTAERWEHLDTSIATDFGLIAIDGPDGPWVTNFRPKYVKVTLNSGPDNGNFGSLRNHNISLINTGNNTIASESWTFGDYNEQYLAYMTINNSLDLDYARLQIVSFMYNNGPYIEKIIFTDIPPYYVLLQDGINSRYAGAFNPDLSFAFSIGAGQGSEGYGISAPKLDPQIVAFAAFSAGAPGEFPVLNTDTFDRVAEISLESSPTAVAVTPDGAYVAFGIVNDISGEVRVAIYRSSDWSNVDTITFVGQTATVDVLKFSPDGSRFFAGGQENRRVIMTYPGLGSETIPTPNVGDIEFADWSPDGSMLVTAYPNSVTNVPFQVFNSDLIEINTGITGSSGQDNNSGVAFNNTGEILAVGISAPPWVRVFSTFDWSEITLGASVNLTGLTVGGMVFSPDDTKLYVTQVDTGAQIITINTSSWELGSVSNVEAGSSLLQNGIAILRNS